jgi:hypothetical protein
VSVKPKGFAKRDQQLADDWQWLATTPEGRRIIADLMTWGNVYSQIEENDPVAMARLVGENNFAKRVAFLLGLKPAQFHQQSWEDTSLMDNMMGSIGGRIQ